MSAREPVLEVWDVRLRTPLPNLGASVLEHWGAQPRESQELLRFSA